MLDPVLLRIAKSVIISAFDNSYMFDNVALLEKYPFLKKAGAAFITLKFDHNLRGCIGSIVAHRSLYEDIANNAASAAFNDPRFHPLHVNELPHINLEVSVLTQPEILEYKDFHDLLEKVVPYVDGLILNYNGHQGTFLPQVWEELKTPKQFLEHLSNKAGLGSDVYDKHPTIYRYRVDAIEDKFEEIERL